MVASLLIFESFGASPQHVEIDLKAPPAHLLPEGCKWQAWTKKVACKNGVDADVVAEMVHNRVPVHRNSQEAAGSSAIAPPSSRNVTRRAVVLMSGLVSRDAGRHKRCTARGKQKQLQATRSQREHLFGSLTHLGFSAHLFLTVNSCPPPVVGSSSSEGKATALVDNINSPHNFTTALARAYEPWLVSLVTSNCPPAESLKGRCLIRVRRLQQHARI